MNKKEIAKYASDFLKNTYNAECSLWYQDPFQLLVSVRLSAQCTDKRVNLVTPALFERFPTADALSKANVTEVEALIKPCGLYKTKAKDLVLMSRMLTEEFHSTVPDRMEDLLKLPGVGRKTANLILGDVYGKPAIVTDTHLIRIANRLGLVGTTDPFKVEMELKKLINPQESSDFCHRVVHFGRDICKARTPGCNECGLNQVCKFGIKRLKKA